MVQTLFGQFVVGPPGSGKSTYCKFVSHKLQQLDRNVKIINLDPANDNLPYQAAIDIRELVTVSQIMEETKYGPNGAMIQCIEALDENFGWLFDKLVAMVQVETDRYEAVKKLTNKDDLAASEANKFRPYLIFDCPGQSELYTHNKAMRSITKKLTTTRSHFDMRLVCVNLCDAYHASDIGKYIGILMISLTTMIHLELPHINVLSKVDKMECYGKTRFNLDFYCEVMDLKYLLETDLESPFFQRYRDLTKALLDVIEDYSYVSFTPLNIGRAEDLYTVLQLADKASGYFVDDVDLSVLLLEDRNQIRS